METEKEERDEIYVTKQQRTIKRIKRGFGPESDPEQSN